MPRSVALLVVALVLTPFSDATPARECRDQKPTTWDLELAPRSEAGERLVLSGRVISRNEHRPVPGVTVYAYHADARGQYNRLNNEGLEARLCGVLRTNARGEYRIRTVMPGGMDPHIHFEAWGPNVLRQAMALNLFIVAQRRDDKRYLKLPKRLHEYRPWQFPTEMRRPVHREKDGVLHATWDIAVRTVETRKLPLLVK